MRIITVLLIGVAIIISMVLCLPLVLGTISYLFELKTQIGVGQFVPSALNSVGLSVLAAAFGGLILWFAENPKKLRSQASDIERRTLKNIRWFGKFFIFAALCFAIFASLAPSLEYLPKSGEQWGVWDQIVRATALVSMMLGCVFFELSLVYSAVLIWLW